ncbi:MAG: hypothetical protein PQJ59_02290 [Spirochaetales bacterium]|nr:hypothetical protein [Spirochaetales bacterium]
MKKLLIIVLAVLLVLPVFASNGDTINIGGVVPLILDLDVDTSAYEFDNLTLVGAAASTTVGLADITISTNNSAGWDLYIYSSNVSGGGNCALINDDLDEVSYTLEFSSTLSAGVGTGASAITDASGTQFGTTTTDTDVTDGLLEITYSTSNDYPAGYYSDQLTVVLRAR